MATLARLSDMVHYVLKDTEKMKNWCYMLHRGHNGLK